MAKSTVEKYRVRPRKPPSPHRSAHRGHSIRLSLTGFQVLQRQTNPNGRIKAYRLYASETEDEWGEPVAEGNLADNGDWQTIDFEQSTTARYLRLVADSERENNTWASLAEIKVLAESSRAE